jgi:hypothetical protein
MPDLMSALPSSLGTFGYLFSKFLGLRLRREPNPPYPASSSSTSSSSPPALISRLLMTRRVSKRRKGSLVRSISRSCAELTAIHYHAHNHTETVAIPRIPSDLCRAVVVVCSVSVSSPSASSIFPSATENSISTPLKSSCASASNQNQ